MKQTIYLDTTIPSAYYDDRDLEIQRLTRIFWSKLKNYTVCISPLVSAEIGNIRNKEKRMELIELLKDAEVLPITSECEQLADLYVKSGIIPVKYRDDALHIAVAVINSIDYLVSWNFEHIVKLKTKRMVGLIDAEKGYKQIEIVVPAEL